MSTTIDGFEILKTIGQSAKLFEDLRSEVNKLALTLIKKKLKSKNMNLLDFKNLESNLENDTLSLIIDSLTETELKSLTKKLDPYLPALSNARAPALRPHLRALAAAQANPSPKPAKAKKISSSKASSADKKPKAANKTPAQAQWPTSASAKPSRLRG
jgi:hypothetical protein